MIFYMLQFGKEAKKEAFDWRMIIVRKNRRKRHSGCLGGVLAFLCIIVGVICISIAFSREDENSFETVGFLTGGFENEDAPVFEENTISEDEVTEDFYYGQLNSEEEKTIYKEILQGILETRETIYLHASDGKTANTIFQSVLYDHPEIFWCDGNVISTSYSKSLFREAYVEFVPTYLYTGEEKERKQAEIEAAADVCISTISEEATDYEKIKTVYEYLINTVEYNLDAPDNQNIYSVLAAKESVCAGYARSTQYLLGKLGIPCAYVTGTSTDSEGNVEDHAWNMVKCEGDWYFVDTTWGDPLFQQEEEESTVRAMTYDYLCCIEDTILKTHTLKEGFTYPECGPDIWNYYRMNGMFYETYDRGAILNAMYASIDSGNDCVVFKFANDEAYEQAHDEILGELVREAASYLGRMYALREVYYSYEEAPSLDKLTIYWSYS